MSIILHKKMTGGPSCDTEACRGLLSVCLSECLSSLLLLSFLNTSSSFQQVSEHLNDLDPATWLSALVLSSLDGYVSAEER